MLRASCRSSRRQLLRTGLGCAAWIGAATSPLGALGRRAFAAQARGRIVAETAYARIEELASGVWAVVSTPLRDGGRHFETTANGGIVAGSDGVAVIEGFYSDEGAAWVGEQARALTGRWPDRVVLTHFHADHCHGLAGLRGPVGELPATHATATTADLMREREEPVAPDVLLATTGEQLDLGGRVLRIATRQGHTPSDVTVELDDPWVVFCGDLVWNRMLPNFVDAIPSYQVRHCEQLLGRSGVTYVPGHGDVADAADLAPFLELLQDLEAAGRGAVAAGVPAEEAAARYRIPGRLGEWLAFSPDYIERAFRAWQRELRGAADPR